MKVDGDRVELLDNEVLTSLLKIDAMRQQADNAEEAYRAMCAGASSFGGRMFDPDDECFIQHANIGLARNRTDNQMLMTRYWFSALEQRIVRPFTQERKEKAELAVQLAFDWMNPKEDPLA